MKAAYYHGASSMGVASGTPVAPGPREVQVQVSHCGLCGTDLHIFHGRMDHRVKRPQVIGHEMSGIIAAVGRDVTGWSAGDRVTVRPLDYCGDCPACRAGHSHICQRLKFIGIDSPGALQQLWTVPAHTLHRLPDSLSLEEAALVEPIAVACHDVRLAELTAGDYVVVLGGGPIGLLVALVAQHAGARVILAELNPFRLRLAGQLGVRAFHPAQTDLVELVNEETGGAGADAVFEVSGSAAGAELMTKLPRTRGRLVVVAIFSEPPKVDLFRFFWRELKMIGARVYEPEDFDRAIALAGAGVIPIGRIVTRVLPMEQVQSAFEEMDRGGEVMKVLIDCSVS